MAKGEGDGDYHPVKQTRSKAAPRIPAKLADKTIAKTTTSSRPLAKPRRLHSSEATVQVKDSESQNLPDRTARSPEKPSDEDIDWEEGIRPESDAESGIAPARKRVGRKSAPSSKYRQLPLTSDAASDLNGTSNKKTAPKPKKSDQPKTSKPLISTTKVAPTHAKLPASSRQLPSQTAEPPNSQRVHLSTTGRTKPEHTSNQFPVQDDDHEVVEDSYPNETKYAMVHVPSKSNSFAVKVAEALRESDSFAVTNTVKSTVMRSDAETRKSLPREPAFLSNITNNGNSGSVEKTTPALVDEKLEKKPNLISWSAKGPRNQGILPSKRRVPSVDQHGSPMLGYNEPSDPFLEQTELPRDPDFANYAFHVHDHEDGEGDKTMVMQQDKMLLTTRDKGGPRSFAKCISATGPIGTTNISTIGTVAKLRSPGKTKNRAEDVEPTEVTRLSEDEVPQKLQPWREPDPSKELLTTSLHQIGEHSPSEQAEPVLGNITMKTPRDEDAEARTSQSIKRRRVYEDKGDTEAMSVLGLLTSSKSEITIGKGLDCRPNVPLLRHHQLNAAALQKSDAVRRDLGRLKVKSFTERLEPQPRSVEVLRTPNPTHHHIDMDDTLVNNESDVDEDMEEMDVEDAKKMRYEPSDSNESLSVLDVEENDSNAMSVPTEPLSKHQEAVREAMRELFKSILECIGGPNVTAKLPVKRFIRCGNSLIESLQQTCINDLEEYRLNLNSTHVQIRESLRDVLQEIESEHAVPSNSRAELNHIIASVEASKKRALQTLQRASSRSG